MKISNKTLSAFNAGKEPCYNENYNKAHGLPTMVEQSFLGHIALCKWGMFARNMKLTQVHIKEWLEWNKWTPSEALIRHAKREGIAI